MKLDNKKKIVLLGTKQHTAKLKILQWNAGGLSSAEMAELKQITVQNDTDLLIINEANSTEENTQYYNIKGFTTHTLDKARQIASRMLVIIKNTLKSEIKIIKEMNDHDTAEIVKISLWIKNKKFTIYGIYSSPGNKYLLLDTLDITPSTVVIGDFNAASPSWRYNYYNHTGRTVEELLRSQKLELLYHPEDQKHSYTTQVAIQTPISPWYPPVFTKIARSKILGTCIGASITLTRGISLDVI